MDKNHIYFQRWWSWKLPQSLTKPKVGKEKKLPRKTWDPICFFGHPIFIYKTPALSPIPTVIPISSIFCRSSLKWISSSQTSGVMAMLDLLGAALSSRKTLKNLTPKGLVFSIRFWRFWAIPAFLDVSGVQWVQRQRPEIHERGQGFVIFSSDVVCVFVRFLLLGSWTKIRDVMCPLIFFRPGF